MITVIGTYKPEADFLGLGDIGTLVNDSGVFGGFRFRSTVRILFEIFSIVFLG